MPTWHVVQLTHHHKRITRDNGCFEDLLGIVGRDMTEQEYEQRSQLSAHVVNWIRKCSPWLSASARRLPRSAMIPFLRISFPRNLSAAKIRHLAAPMSSSFLVNAEIPRQASWSA